jgi:hypothetical protein
MRRAPAVDVPTEPYDPSLGLPGLIVPDGRNQHFSITTRSLNNNAFFVRFQAPRALTIAAIAFEVTTADAANPNMDVGIYTVSGLTMTRVASAGATAGKGNATGVQAINLSAPYTLDAGAVYFAGVAAAAGSVAVRGFNTGAADSMQLFGSASDTARMQYAYALFANAVTPFPASIASPGPPSASVLLGLRTA